MLNEKSTLENKWEEYRQKARFIENDIDSKLLQFAKLTTKDARSSRDENYDKTPLISSDDIFDRSSCEIESLLKKLTEINNRMAEYCDKLHNQSKSSATYTLQRHREILNDYSNEFRKTKSNIASQLEREQLLNSVSRKDDFSSITSPSKISDLYLKEQDHIHSSEIMVDEQISIAIKTREGLIHQRNTIKAIQTQLTTLANRFPLLNSLIHRIDIKKRKDSLILGAVIGVCMFLLLLYII